MRHLEIIPYILLALSIVVEITPIKINPLSRLLKWVGKQINGELMSRLTNLEIKVDNNEKDRIRHEIFTFANNLRNGKRIYTYEEFQHIFELNEKYKNMGGNGQIKIEMKYIQSEYLKLGGR